MSLFRPEVLPHLPLNSACFHLFDCFFKNFLINLQGKKPFYRNKSLIKQE